MLTPHPLQEPDIQGGYLGATERPDRGRRWSFPEREELGGGITRPQAYLSQ